MRRAIQAAALIAQEKSLKRFIHNLLTLNIDRVTS